MRRVGSPMFECFIMANGCFALAQLCRLEDIGRRPRNVRGAARGARRLGLRQRVADHRVHAHPAGRLRTSPRPGGRGPAARAGRGGAEFLGQFLGQEAELETARGNTASARQALREAIELILAEEARGHLLALLPLAATLLPPEETRHALERRATCPCTATARRISRKQRRFSPKTPTVSGPRRSSTAQRAAVRGGASPTPRGRPGARERVDRQVPPRERPARRRVRRRGRSAMTGPAQGGYVVLRRGRGDSWRILGEVERRPGAAGTQVARAGGARRARPRAEAGRGLRGPAAERVEGSRSTARTGAGPGARSKIRSSPRWTSGSSHRPGAVGSSSRGRRRRTSAPGSSTLRERYPPFDPSGRTTWARARFGRLADVRTQHRPVPRA